MKTILFMYARKYLVSACKELPALAELEELEELQKLLDNSLSTPPKGGSLEQIRLLGDWHIERLKTASQIVEWIEQMRRWGFKFPPLE